MAPVHRLRPDDPSPTTWRSSFLAISDVRAVLVIAIYTILTTASADFDSLAGMKALFCFAIVIAARAVAAGEEPKPADAKKPAQQLMPLVFLPGGGSWKGETPVRGATWTALKEDPAAPFSLMAHAGVGDRFPATDASGFTHFEVLVENGTADHLALRVISEEGEQKIRVPNDKGTEFAVRGKKWMVTFPTRRVMADPGTKPSTDKAMILIRQQESGQKK